MIPHGGVINATERTALYRLYDADRTLLYVGIAKTPEERWQQHATSPRSPWWVQVVTKEVEWFESRDAADRAETAAINDERPRYNRAKVVGRPTKWGTGFRSPEINWRNTLADPASDQAARILRSEIKTGEIPPGGVMPTTKELSRRFGLTEQTCNLIVRRLADEGLIYQPRPRSRYLCVDPTREAAQSTHAKAPRPSHAGEKPDYKVFRFAVNQPEQAAAAVRSKMTDEQWIAFVAAASQLHASA